jgi:S1-C subfamily serine protease
VRGSTALLLFSAVAAAGELANAEREIVKVAKNVRPSVVTVYTPEKKDADLSGVIISSSGVILTLRKPLLTESGHLPDKVQVRFPGKGRTAVARVLDDEPVTNTCLLQVTGLTTRPIRPRHASDIRLGMWVLLVGNAFGTGRESTPTVSLGVVSGLVRDGDRITGIHASTLVNPGSGGAPVIDAGGGLLGVIAQKWTEAGGQSIVIPFGFIRDRYRSKGGDGSAVFSSPPRKRSRSTRVSDLLGEVVAAVAGRGRGVLVGVRAAKLPDDPPPSQPKPEKKANGKEKKKKGPPKIPQPRPVGGTLPAYDRCSGVIVSADGLVLCPLRVTGWPGRTRPLTVDLADGRALEAHQLGHDERLRIALLSIDADKLPLLEDAPEDALATGRFAVALGYPHEEPHRGSPQVTLGILSRTGGLKRLHPAFHALQTDAAVAGGNRGGPLLDIDGRLMGMLLDVNDTDGKGYQLRAKGSYEGNAGLGFALPMRQLRALLPRLEKGHVLRTPFLGVSTRPAEKGGLEVMAVTEKNSKGEETASQRAGLQKGDILLELGGKEITEQRSLREALTEYTVGDEVVIVFKRGEQRKSAAVILGER